MLTAVKAKKVFDLLFIEAHNIRACTECAKLDGFKVVASKAGTKVFEIDALDVTYPIILSEMCAAVPTDFAWNDLHSKLEETGEKPDDEEPDEKPDDEEPDAAQKEEVSNA
jgi:hypothetical protein